jgi:hypothetical protein
MDSVQGEGGWSIVYIHCAVEGVLGIQVRMRCGTNEIRVRRRRSIVEVGAEVVRGRIRSAGCWDALYDIPQLLQCAAEL